jgi:hypothetical protein
MFLEELLFFGIGWSSGHSLMQYVSLTVRACQVAVKLLSLDCRCALLPGPLHRQPKQYSISFCQRMTCP